MEIAVQYAGAAGSFLKFLPELGDIVYKATHSTSYDVSRPLIKCSLAAKYGNLASHLQAMDDSMKTMIGVTIQAISKQNNEMSWENAHSCMLNNPVLEPKSGIERSKSLTNDSFNWLSFGSHQPPDSSPEVRRIETWIKDLINDEDIFADLSFESITYARFVASSGAALDSLLSIAYRNDTRYKSVIEVGVLRYPDMDHPYFKLYRVSLKAYAESTAFGTISSNKNGIIGEFNCQKFGIRESFVRELSPEVNKKAHANVKALFDD